MARWGSLVLALGIVWSIYAALCPRYALNACLRLALPLGDVPPIGNTRIAMSPAKNVAVAEGGNLQVRVNLSGQTVARPPEIVWMERVRSVEPAKSGAERAPMMAAPAGETGYVYAFANVRRAFAFRVVAGDTYTRNIRVTVSPLPRIRESQFIIRSPPYTGLGSTQMPGPPCSVSCLSGTVLQTTMDIAPPVRTATWKGPEGNAAFQQVKRRLAAETTIASAGAYTIETVNPDTSQTVALAKGDIALLMDKAPEVEFLTDALNRFETTGSTLTIDILASDDYGISNLFVTAAMEDSEQPARLLKTWTYLGPPGPAGPVKERFALTLDTEIFLPGAVYGLTACATDFCPGGKPGKSRPLVLRIKTLADLQIPAGNNLEIAFAALKRAIAAQEKAKGVTENFGVHLDEAVNHQSIPSHQEAMTDRQEEARVEATTALEAFGKHKDGRIYALRLTPLVNLDMPQVLADIAGITNQPADKLPAGAVAIEERQAMILNELIKILGAVAERKSTQPEAQPAAGMDQPPAIQPEDAVEELKEDLSEFTKAQKRIIEQSRTLADQGQQDLTAEEQKILGELAKEEAKWAQFFQEKMTDFSKLPMQDFTDGSIAKELNEIFQEVEGATEALRDQAVDLAVPHEQSGLENAKEFVNNLERWIASKPDNIKWSMEEPLAQADIAVGELPGELEDIVGELIDKEEAMTEDVEDVTSSWLDSLDKGAGWDAIDGPISDMSAKGITGNLLPNKQEVSGRSGEGRTGRSHGQMVEETAAGKEGRKTPSRLTPSPFEQGSIKDTSKDEPGGGTGGGKVSGSTSGDGLRGPTPPPLLRQMARLSGKQTAIRQEAEAAALKLRKYHLPSGDLESSILEMTRLEAAAKQGYGAGIRQSYSRAMDALKDAQSTIRIETGLRREQTRLPEQMRKEIMSGLEDGVPRGYEDLVGAYFRALAEMK
jgi:hypothetical protein